MPLNIDELAVNLDEPLLRADGLDDACVGYVTIDDVTVLCYSVDECIEIFVKQGMSREDAREHFAFNVEGAYVGERTPLWIHST